ncbi:zonular occludens toxin domain-containing protein [Pseudomonas anguilliseptica]|uniref:zonular occludens toxin domain-containing protein n=1 Tax=Pseudomonas anguilliseptica TaxID=53406 RepID=UPI00325ADD89
MAIEAYVGLPGHGKSYGVVEHVVLPSIMEGRHVVTNIPLEVDEIIADYGTTGSQITQLPEDWFERADLADFIPNGSVLILDELWRRWPSGLKANQASLPDKSLLAEHRHRVDASGRSMRVVLVTQDLSQLAAWVRILVEQTYKMTKLTAIGATKKYRVDIYLGAPTGQNIPKSKLIRQTFGQYKKEIYRYYSSATQSATGTVGDESKADKRGTVWRYTPTLVWTPILSGLILGPLLAYHRVTLFLSPCCYICRFHQVASHKTYLGSLVWPCLYVWNLVPFQIQCQYPSDHQSLPSTASLYAFTSSAFSVPRCFQISAPSRSLSFTSSFRSTISFIRFAFSASTASSLSLYVFAMISPCHHT